MSNSNNPFALLFSKNIEIAKPAEAASQKPQTDLSVLLERIFLITLDNSNQKKNKNKISILIFLINFNRFPK